jgi:hypothetical protein
MKINGTDIPEYFSKLNRFPTVDELVVLVASGFELMGAPFDEKACRHAIESDGVEAIVTGMLATLPPAMRDATLRRMRGQLN